MIRRDFLAIGSGLALADLNLPLAALSQDPPAAMPANPSSREPVLVRTGFTRSPDRKNVSAGPNAQQTVVRSSDSEGRLAAFVVPVAEHRVHTGAPLHLHHKQDEWIHVLAGEFVAEVGGTRFRLKPGDSLLMPMQIPHRWSIAGQPHCGAVHLYTPAGLMDISWDPHPDEPEPQTLEERKAVFEKYGMSLLGAPLTKDEIDQTL